MYLVIFASIKDGMRQKREDLYAEFCAYLNDQSRHPGVTLRHGGPTLADDGEAVNGLMQVVEAPSVEAARVFMADSPYGQAALFAECHVRPFRWKTGSPS